MNRQISVTCQSAIQRPLRFRLGATAALAVALGLMNLATASAEEFKLTLTGSQEVPAVQSAGSGSGTITINDDMTVSGSIKTTGIMGTKAHIHEAAAGKNGPVIVELKKDGDNWTVPAGTKLTAVDSVRNLGQRGCG